MKDFLIFSVFFFKISKDKEEVHIVLEDLKIRFHEYCEILDSKHKKLLINLYYNLLKCNNISKFEKQKLIILYRAYKNKLK